MIARSFLAALAAWTFGAQAAPEPFPSTYRAVPSAPTLIRNATVLDGTGRRLDGADVLIREGSIVAVGPSLAADGATVVDAQGRWVTPGLIDVHSHLTVGAPSVIPPAASTDFEVTVSDSVVGPVPLALVGVSQDGVLLGAGLTDATGTAVFPIEAPTAGADVTIRVTAHNHLPTGANVIVAAGWTVSLCSTARSTAATPRSPSMSTTRTSPATAPSR